MTHGRSRTRRALIAAFVAGSALPGLAADADPYRLVPGDRLSFSVLFLPELTREVDVNVDGTAFLPLVGEVPAEGLSLGELRDAIDLRLRQEPIRLPGPSNRNDPLRTLRGSEVMIDIAEYRPVYVTRAVATPGEIEFRPGMTVRQAIVRSGGIGISTDELDELRLLDLRTRRDEIASQVVARRERISRMQADLRGLVDGAGSSAADAAPAEDAALLADEIEMAGVSGAWLEAREARRDSERRQIEATVAEMLERLEVLEELQTVGDEFVDATEAELARVTDLRQRGRGREEEIRDARENLLLASSRALNTANELLRLREQITETEADLSIVEIDDRIELIEGLEAEVFDLTRLEKLLGSLDRNLRLVGEGSGEDPSTVVIRSFPGGAGKEPVEVSPGDPLAPGDVIEVVIREGEASGSL